MYRLSLVVPATSVTMNLSLPIRELINDDLPALGLPTTANLGTSEIIRSSFGSLSDNKSKNSPVPDPLIDDKQNRFSKPRE